MEESELIDNYLQGNLTEDELNLTEVKFANDKDFRKKVILRKAIIAGIGEGYSEELKERLVEFDRSLERKKSVFKFSWKIAAMFAGLLLVATIGIIRFSIYGRQLGKYDLNEIGIPNAMGSNKQVELAEAMNNFKAENYETALAKFQSLLKSNPNNDTLLYFEGVSAYRVKRYPLAVNSFSMVVNQHSHNYSEISEYRLALAYLSDGENQKAREIFSAISKNSKHKFHQQATRVIDEQF